MRPAETAIRPLVLLLAVAACATTGQLTGDPADYGSPDPEMAVSRFLDGVQSRDYQAMGRQFGTREGPAEARLGVSEVEQRMIVLAGILRHDSYSLERADLAQLGPDRARFLATLTGTRYGRVELPVIAVSAGDERWFVERIETDALDRSRRR